MRHTLMAMTAIMATASIAGATGGFDCQIEDAIMTFWVSGSISHGMGGAILGYQAEAEIMAPMMPESLRKPDLSAALVHHWIDHPELWLHFYAETTGDAPFASFDLILKSQGTEEELAYAGDYVLHAFDGETGEAFDLTGKVTCQGE